MTTTFAARQPHARISRSGRALAVVLPVLVAVLGLSGCDRVKKDKTPSQAAARVNSQEITIHQINQVLEQQRGLPPAQAASASRQVLTRLIDQELALQEAQNQKLDRDPKVVRQLEAARREIIARAYIERVGSTVPRPTAEEIKKYYEANPALFKERRIYNFEELTIEAKPEQIEAIKAAHQAAKTPAAFVDYLKAQGLRFNSRQALTPAEQLPLGQLGAISRMNDGQSTVTVFPQGLLVLTLVDSRLQPVEEERARLAIEQFLVNERRQKTVQNDLATLRAAAKIEYVGEFAGAASGVPSAPQDAPSAASGPSAQAVENALKGLK
jgi:EpsD family peptidyl-prolyl cis-trans isomerase